MKRVTAGFLAVFAVVNITVVPFGCGERTSGGGTLRVALVTPGPVSDQAWNSGAYNGLLRIRDSLGASISNVETEDPTSIQENFRQYGAQGYTLVFGHGFEFQDPAERAGREFPRTIYVATSGNRSSGNFASMEFAFEEGSFVAGMIAAGISSSGILGCIGGTDLPPVKRSFAAFEQGARLINPAVKVVTSYVGNWSDASAGKELALAQIGRGVDVIFGNADAAGLGVFQAAKEKARVRIIGANSDQAHVAPEVVIGSVVIDLPHAFLSVAREVQAGTFTPRVISFGTKSDVVRWAFNPALEATVPARVRSRVDSVIATQRAGSFALRTPPAQ